MRDSGSDDSGSGDSGSEDPIGGSRPKWYDAVNPLTAAPRGGEEVQQCRRSWTRTACPAPSHVSPTKFSNATAAPSELALVGIRTRGVPLARRLAHSLQDINHEEVPPARSTSRSTATT